jgi:hypothetical protein
MRFQSTYFHMYQLFNFHKKQSQHPLLVHVNFTTSSHSCQYDFIMHKRMRRLFNFHETKEKKSKHATVHLSCVYSWDSDQNPLPNALDARLFNFHETK